MRPLLLVLLAACGTADSLDGPRIDATRLDSLEPVTLTHTPVTVDRELTLTGQGFQGTSQGPWVRFGDVEAPSVRILDENTVIALVPQSVHGVQTVTLVNPDERTAEVTVDLQ